MNYSGKFDTRGSADGAGPYPSGHIETVHASHAPADAIVVPDAQLLFQGDFRRCGVDLVLSKDDRELVLNDYFKGEKRAALSSPDGAHLTGDLVGALSGHVEYAQADGNASVSHVIGHVSKLVGSGTAIRNGVSIVLNNGDNVEKGDVIESGSNSTLGITFIDGTVFGLSSNARMVLNELVYDPTGSNNSSLLSLVAGTITFVAGETAKHGDMKVDTPVATMGIRGTAVLVEIDFNIPGQLDQPEAHFQVLVEPDGTTGSYVLFEKNTLTRIAEVNKAGEQINIVRGQVTISNEPLPPDVQDLVRDVFKLKFSDANPKFFDHFTDTVIPPSLQPFQFANGATATPLILFTTTPASNSSPFPSTYGPTFNPIYHIDQPPVVVVSGNTALTVGTGTSQTGVGVTGTIRFADINAGDLPTVSTSFVSFKLVDARNVDITATLTSQQIAAVAAHLVVTPSPGNNNNGSATWAYSVADTAFNFLTAGETLTLTYDAMVNNNYLPLDQVTTVPFTITINPPSFVEWIHPTGGLWSVGSNWSSGSVPTATDGAIIPAQNIRDGTGLYDVRIETPAVARNLTLNANDTTGGQVINDSTLSIGEVLTIFNDGVINNSALRAVIVGSKMELLDQSSLQNSGLIRLGHGGDFTDSSSVTNSGTIEITGGTLNVQVDIANSGGIIQIDDGAVLTLTGIAIINGGTINDGTASGTGGDPVFGSIDVTGPSTIGDAFLNNGGVTVASGVTLTLDNDTVNGTSFTDTASGATIRIDDGTVLTLTGGATIDGGTINDGAASGTDDLMFGSIDVTGPSTISNASLNNGRVTVASGVTLTMDNDTVNGTTFTDSASGATIQIDDGTVLTLTGGATINGGTVNDGTANGADAPAVFGSIDVTGLSTISNAFLNNGGVTIASGAALTLSNDTVAGTTFIDGVAISGSFGGTIGISGAVTFQSGVAVNGGAMSIAKGATLDIENPVTGIGATLNDVYVMNSGTIQVDLSGPGATIISLVLEGGTTVIGGTLLIHVGFPVGSIEGAVEIGTGGATFDNVAVKNNNVLTIDDGITLMLDDNTVVTNGNLAIGALGMLDVEQGRASLSEGTPDATLDGVAVANGGNIDVGTAGPRATLLLDGGTTVSNGVLAVGSAGTLEIGAGGATLSNVSVNNNHVIEILAGSILTLDIGTTVANVGTAMAVDGTAALVLNGATIDGGTLSGVGTIVTVGGANILDNVAIASVTTVNVADNTLLNLIDAIANNGTIALNASGGSTQLEISGNALLNGSGEVALSDDSHNMIGSDGSGATLTNSNTITGAGTIGDMYLTLVNDGTIDATGANLLTIDTGVNTATSAGPEGSAWFVGSLTVTNDVRGVLEASDGHTLQINDNVLNNGLIEAGNNGGTSTAVVNVTGNITGTGSIEIFANAKVEIGGSVSSGQIVTFEVSNGGAELILDHPNGFQGLVKGLVEASSEAADNYIDLKGFSYTSEMQVVLASFNSTTDTTAVTITNGNSANNITINLYGDYHNGDFGFANDGAGGTLFSDPAANSGAVTIGSGTTLDIGAASTATVSFANSNGNTGELVLDNSKHFTGHILGFAGDGTISNSDLIDLADVNVANVATSKTSYTDDGNDTGTLTLYNANGQALDSITFRGSYQLANFTIENDGSGHTLIVDPPVSSGTATSGNGVTIANTISNLAMNDTGPAVNSVVMHDPGSAPSSTIAAAMPNQTLSGLAASDTLVFNFVGAGHATVADFHPLSDILQFGNSIFANAQAVLNATQDDGHGNTIISIDGHDTLTLSDVLKAQLHIGDFHVV